MLKGIHPLRVDCAQVAGAQQAIARSEAPVQRLDREVQMRGARVEVGGDQDSSRVQGPSTLPSAGRAGNRVFPS